MNYYEILECKPDADPLELKKSYQRLVLQCHPDKKQTATNSLAIYLKIDEAWKVLRDPEKRKIYDAELYEIKVNKQSNVFAELDIEKDFVESPEGNLSYPCRCGDFYEIHKDDIAVDENEFIIECNQCSLVVTVKSNKNIF